MTRKVDVVRLEQIVDAIKRYPGRKPGRIAREIGLDNKTMMRALPQLEAHGHLLAEDDRGRLLWVGTAAFDPARREGGRG